MDLVDFKKYINFTAIDFETANSSPSSICQIGLARFENGTLVHSVDQLVRPPENMYQYYNTKVHGIHSKMTENAPTFEQLWPSMKQFIQHQHVVAHNIQFDSTCLKQVLQHYDLPGVYYTKHCTVRIYKRGLAHLCDRYNIDLQHHNAYSDALACAHLFVKYLEESERGKFKL